MKLYRRALITGASSGIGAAFARESPPRIDLLLTGRDQTRLEQIRVAVSRPNRNVDTLEADLRLVEDRDRLIAGAEAFEIDLLINNAGLGAYGPVLENDADVDRATTEVNVVATADLTRRLLPGMIERAKQSGRRAGLINVSSTLAFQPMPFLASYAASKMFVLMYSQALAAELRNEPVDILTLCPGATRTAFGRRAGFEAGNLFGASEPEVVARQAFHVLGRRAIHVVGPVSRSVLSPGLMAQHLATQVLGAAMRTFGDAGRRK